MNVLFLFNTEESDRRKKALRDRKVIIESGKEAWMKHFPLNYVFIHKILLH